MSDFYKIISDAPFEYNEPNLEGKCCKTDGTGSFTTKTKRQCLNSGGFWIESTRECPKQTKKTCCRYTTSGGTTTITRTDNITECACYKQGNNVRWGDYAVSGCPANQKGLLSNSCCHWGLSGNDYINKCTEVDTIQECASLNEGTPDGLKYTFHSGKSCVYNGGEIICNGTKKTPESLSDTCFPDTSQECFKQEFILGNCCEQFSDETVACSITTKSECLGFWNYFGVIKSCVTGSLCSGVYFPKKENELFVPTTASYNTLLSSTNILEKLPSTYTQYQGGVYAGIFEPGVSTVLGNEISGKAQTYKSKRNGPGTTNRRWIIIVSNTDVSLPSLSLLTNNTSSYDGFYNMEQQPVQNIWQENINGFTDWYIPSKQEWEFVSGNLGKNYTTNGMESLSKEFYLTSTVLTVSSGLPLVYCQMNNVNKYGDVFLSPKQNISSNPPIRLIRRIYLGV